MAVDIKRCDCRPSRLHKAARGTLRQERDSTKGHPSGECEVGQEACLVCFTLRACSRVQLLSHQEVASSLKDYFVAVYGNFEALGIAQVGETSCLVDEADSELFLFNKAELTLT